MPLCQYCGWGGQVKPACSTPTDALHCDLNKENRRKYRLRYRLPPPLIVKSLRYQGKEGKGDSYERLIPQG